MNTSSDIAAVVLAGGLARRMGGADKALLPLAGRPLLSHVLAALGSPPRPCAISANGDPARFAAFGLPVLADSDDTRPGPLAGIATGLRWARAQGAQALVSAAVDTPILPGDLLERLRGASSGMHLTHARAGGRDHPTLALWPIGLLTSLEDYLARGERRMMGFMALHEAIAVEWDSPDLFVNLNTPDDLARAEALLAQRPKTCSTGTAS
ncbi:MAG: molybdenum cofactor guanylyltransferase [Proteobacteria bacterium]|nr:molybdenum cofactor guanylyltransferase [Pseudomonadota bacterium]